MIDATKHTVEFIKTFDASLDPDLWLKLVEEEYKEVAEARRGTDQAHLLKEIADLIYVMTPFVSILDALDGLPVLSADREAKYAMAIEKSIKVIDAMVDMYGEKTIQEAVDRVHASNMSKLGEDGKPIRREDGKILKGPNYKEPDLSDLVR